MLRQFLVGGGVSLVTIAIHALVMTMVVHVARTMSEKQESNSYLVLIVVMIPTISVLMAGCQKRNSHSRVCQRPARERGSAVASGYGRFTLALPAGDDDLVCFHPRPLPPGGRVWRLAARAPRRWHSCLWRHDPSLIHRNFCDTTALCDVPFDPRKTQTVSSAGETIQARRPIH